MSTHPVKKPFTGWHMTAILVGFFAIIMAVNFTMARLAFSTFGGKVVENSYVASQHYNELLARAEAQDAMGWTQSVSLDRTRHMRITLRQNGQPLAISSAIATVSHPLGTVPSRALTMVRDGKGGMISTVPLEQGRWRVDLVVRHDAQEARYRSDVR
ncbi:FixH family protein [Blastomonas sp.]|uniref:FixH family protein n=1 Tax=Blastomonas sp. TaxID=1909299 RepID=UPI0039188F87